MRCADVSARHEEVVNIARVQTTIWHSRRIDNGVACSGLVFVAREADSIGMIGLMQVDTPRRCKRRIFVCHVAHKVVLLQHIVAQQSARLPFADEDLIRGLL